MSIDAALKSDELSKMKNISNLDLVKSQNPPFCLTLKILKTLISFRRDREKVSIEVR